MGVELFTGGSRGGEDLSDSNKQKRSLISRLKMPVVGLTLLGAGSMLEKQYDVVAAVENIPTMNYIGAKVDNFTEWCGKPWGYSSLSSEHQECYDKLAKKIESASLSNFYFQTQKGLDLALGIDESETNSIICLLLADDCCIHSSKYYSSKDSHTANLEIIRDSKVIYLQEDSLLAELILNKMHECFLDRVNEAKANLSRIDNDFIEFVQNSKLNQWSLKDGVYEGQFGDIRISLEKGANPETLTSFFSKKTGKIQAIPPTVGIEEKGRIHFRETNSNAFHITINNELSGQAIALVDAKLAGASSDSTEIAAK